MATIEKSIEVGKPINTVYQQWTQFENFPQFMTGIKEVRQLDEQHLHWKAEIGGRTEEWDAEIFDRVPNQRLSWRSTSGAKNSGTVNFVALDPANTRLILNLNYDPQGIMETVGDNLGLVSARVTGDLNRFKEYSEAKA